MFQWEGYWGSFLGSPIFGLFMGTFNPRDLSRVGGISEFLFGNLIFVGGAIVTILYICGWEFSSPIWGVK